jgi:hypothetical protein
MVNKFPYNSEFLKLLCILCLFFQVNLEAKVICSSSIPRALTREAEFTDTKFLTVGRSNNTYHR